jgi:hypothetical protein
MPLTKKDIEEQREQAQEDIRSILDGTDRITDRTTDNICQVVVDKMNVIIAKLEGKPEENNGEYISLQECRKSGKHLTSCDGDGYCNFCGEQES